MEELAERVMNENTPKAKENGVERRNEKKPSTVRSHWRLSRPGEKCTKSFRKPKEIPWP